VFVLGGSLCFRQRLQQPAGMAAVTARAPEAAAMPLSSDVLAAAVSGGADDVVDVLLRVAARAAARPPGGGVRGGSAARSSGSDAPAAGRAAAPPPQSSRHGSSHPPPAGGEARLPVVPMRALETAHWHYARGDMAACVEVCEAAAASGGGGGGGSKEEEEAFQMALLAGAAYYQADDAERSLAASARAAALRPSAAEPYSNMANVLKELGHAAAARLLYEKALELAPDFADGHGNLGALLLHEGAHEAALAHFEAALAVRGDNAYWHVDVGHLYRLAGRLPAAKAAFATALRLAPGFAIAWSNMACVLKEEGDVAGAGAHYERAIELDPTFFDALANCGNVCKDAGRLSDAEALYRRALALRPDNAIVMGNLASVLLERGQLEDSLALFRAALDLLPDFPDCLSNMGNALKAAGRCEEALAAYHRCLALTSYTHTDGLNNAANAYKEVGDAVTAEAMYRRAIALRPGFAGAHSNLGNLLKDQFRLTDALAEYEAAIAADPRFADAWSNMGNCLKDMNRFTEAVAAYETAIALRPTFADALGNLASVYKDTGALDRAIDYYRRALALRPGAPDPVAYCNLVHCLAVVCDWRDQASMYATMTAILGRQMADGGLPAVQPHHALVYPLAPRDQLRIAAHYGAAAARAMAAAGASPHVAARATDAVLARLRGAVAGTRRLRVGYVSSDLGNHPLAHLMQHVFTWADRAVFEVVAYATSGDDGSPWRRTIAGGVERFVEAAGMPHSTLAAAIAEDGIDVLVNLNGYTKGSRNEVFALQPAPVQVGFLGFPGSSGAAYMQYYVGDAVATPRAASRLFTERLAYMPASYFVNDHAASFPEALEAAEGDALEARVAALRAAAGLPPRPAVVYAMFNQLYKVDPATFATWMRVLTRVPTAVLWLLQFPAMGEAPLREAARAAGVDPRRLIFSPVAPKAAHIARGAAADLFLDTPVCNAHTTGTDILWGGVPVLTLPGEVLASRVGASLLAAAGLGDAAAGLVAPDLAAYEDTAVALGTDLPRLRALQAAVRASRTTSPLFDTRAWVADWGRLLTAIVADYVGPGGGDALCSAVAARAAAAAAGDVLPLWDPVVLPRPTP